MDTRTRAWAYRIGGLAILVLIAVDVAAGGDAQRWVLWVAAAIGLGEAGLATKHTSTKREP